MVTVVARKLRPWEGKTLHAMKRQLSNAVNSLHARIILLSRGGVANGQIANFCGCSPTWVRVIIHRFNDGGVDAITWYPYYCHRAGPRKFMADITEQIAQVALSPPKELIGLSVWSLPKLRDYLVEQKIVGAISIERLRQILCERKVRWRHTKTWKDSTDPNFWLKYRKIRRLYRHRPESGRRICVDEFGPLNLLPRHGMHYARTSTSSGATELKQSAFGIGRCTRMIIEEPDNGRLQHETAEVETALVFGRDMTAHEPATTSHRQ